MKRKTLLFISTLLWCITLLNNVSIHAQSGYALNLPGGADGSNSNISIPALQSNITGYPYTVEMLVKPNQWTSYAGIWVSRDATNSNASGLQFDNNADRRLRCDVEGAGRIVDLSTVTPTLNEWHHMALIVTATEVTVVVDGTSYAAGSAPNSFSNAFGYQSYIGWDPAIASRTLTGLVDEIRIWNIEKSAAELNATITDPTTETGLVAYYNFDDNTNGVATDLTSNGLNGTISGGSYISVALSTDNTLSGLSADVGTLSPTFDANVTSYYLEVPEGTPSVDITASANDANATVTGDGTINLSAGYANVPVLVTAENGEELTYTILIETGGCYTPLYNNATNLISDPKLNSLDGFGGWGHKSIVYGEAYCGAACVKFDGTTNGWPDGAAMDVTIAWAANTTYRTRFMVKTVDGTLALVTNTTDPNFAISIPQSTNKWIEIDTVFTTGANTGTSFISINNADASSTGKVAYIDNYELYAVPNTEASLANLTFSSGKLEPAFDYDIIEYNVSLQPGVTEVTPTATPMLSNSVVTGTSAVDLSSGSGTSIIQVTAPDAVSTKTYTVHYTVASVSTDATLSALTVNGATLTPAFDAAVTSYYAVVSEGTGSTVVTATVADNKANLTGDGNLDLSLGSNTATFTVTAEDGSTQSTYTVEVFVENTACFEPLYNDRSNIITDPYISDISNFEGWGNHSVDTYPPNAYCGSTCGFINGGSLDYNLTGSLQPNTSYRVKAMVKAASTNARIGVFGWSSGQADITTYATVVGDWEPIDFVFTTGATLATKYGLFFNNSAGSYIDNWEIYEVSTDASLSEISLSTGIINEVITAETLHYTAIVPIGTTSVTVTATANDNLALVTSTETIVNVSSGTGSATITVLADDGSTSKEYTVDITVDTTTGIQKTTRVFAEVYPTISNHNFTVKFFDTPGTITVYNLVGSIVKQMTHPSNEEVIFMDKPGIYFIKVQSQSQSKLVKVIKSK